MGRFLGSTIRNVYGRSVRVTKTETWAAYQRHLRCAGRDLAPCAEVSDFRTCPCLTPYQACFTSDQQ